MSRLCLYLFIGSVLVMTAGCESPAELDWHQQNGYRWAAVEPGQSGSVGFDRLRPSETGIQFTNRLTEDEIERNQHYMNGSGVAVGDVTGNGWPDLYFARLNGPNRLYENRGGFEFRNITDSAGVGHEGHYSTSTIFADIDGDGDLDLLVGSMSKGIAIYENEGRGHFRRRSGTKMEVGKGNMTMALSDIEGDGDLDLYVANYKERPVRDIYPVSELSWEKTVRSTKGEGGTEHVVVPPYDEHYTIIERDNAPNSRRETGEKDALYLNDGNGGFQKMQRPEARLLAPDGSPRGLPSDWGLNASFRDINQDGLPDLYVNNDFWTPDRVWMNQGNGTFRATDSLAIRNSSFSSMTVDFSDINRDGALDFFVTEMLSPEHQRRLRQFTPSDPFPENRIGSRPQYNRNSLYLNRGDDTYAEIAYFSGVQASEWSWGVRFIDVNLNGYEDLIVNTGFSYDYQDLDSQAEMGRRMAQTPGDERFMTEYPRLRLENQAFRNDKDLTFSRRGREWGISTEQDVSHGLATADFDRDGDLDLVVSRLNDTALLYENTATAPRIAVRFSGAPPNTRAVGATLELEGGPGGPSPQVREVTAGGDYLSGSSTTVMFAADAENANHVLTVTWPDGTSTTIDSVQANRVYEVRKAGSQMEPEADTAPGDASSDSSDSVFRDVSARLGHRHTESTYDDFRIQPLLPIKLSQQGPGVSWIDYDGDGDQDLLVPSGRGGELAVYENTEAGRFSRRTFGSLTDTASADQTALLGWSTADGTHLILGRANYEPGDVQTPSAIHFLAQNDSVREVGQIAGVLSTTGPLAAADYDGDGDVDLFVGGRFVPAQYPRDATSRLFLNEEGQFVQDEANTGLLDELGLVTGAVFTDYDQDGDPDLLVSRAWDSLKLFENQNGTFRDVTKQVGLHRHTGWWQGVATGDFNNDGRPDIVATNWGTNTPYEPNPDNPAKMHYRDFNRNGRVEIVESYYDADTGGYVPRRQLGAFESTPVPFASSVDSHAQFASSTLKDLLGENFAQALSVKEINTVKHTLFLNEVDSFSARPLPEYAQFSAVFHAGVGDYDNDGNEDLFLSQNFFEVRADMPRLDAGRGLLLRGDGNGHFDVIPGHQSGIKVYGKQRGAAFGDFDRDARVDLAVSQNGAATKLYQNQTPKRGLRVVLRGLPANQDAIGARLRVIYADGSKGPQRSVQAGSGYWSQNSAVQVLGTAREPAAVEVTWSDGETTTIEVGPDRHEVVATHPEIRPES